MRVDLDTTVGPLQLPNPVIAAAGCAGTGRELTPFCDIAALGALVTKSVMVRPRAGNPAPRVAETPSGMVSAVGLQGPGIEVLLQRDLPWLVSQGARAVVSLAGSSPEEYAELGARLGRDGTASAVEVNLASPNQADRGRAFGGDPAAAAEVVRAVAQAAGPELPVVAKLSADVGDLGALADACLGAGADVLAVTNTLRALSIDVDARRPAITGGFEQGGLSGPAVRPIALAAVYQLHEEFPGVPIIGVGGVRTGVDVMEFLLAGACAVGVGTAIFHDPSACERIVRELAEGLEARGVARASDLVGGAHQRAADGGGR